MRQNMTLQGPQVRSNLSSLALKMTFLENKEICQIMLRQQTYNYASSPSKYVSPKQEKNGQPDSQSGREWMYATPNMSSKLDPGGITTEVNSSKPKPTSK